jgi:hypothetical protein
MSYILTANTPPPVVIHLDSGSSRVQQLETGLTTNFLYVLKEPILVPDHMNLLLSLHTATIPYSFYNVGSHNNLIRFVLDGVNKDLTLESGNYSAFSLLNNIKNFLEAEASITTFHISYTRETLKFKMGFEGSATTLTISTDSTALELIGFPNGGTIPKSSTTRITSVNAIDLNDAIHGLFVRQNLATKGTLDTNEGTFSNILARLPITTNAGGIIFYTPSSNQHETMVSLPIIQTIGIRLTDDRHRSINLNGLHFQLSLKVSFIHKEILRPLPPRRIAPNTEVKIDERKKSKKK